VPRIEVCVECDWAARAASHAVRDIGAAPVQTPTPVTAGRSLRESAALIYDLSPWDGAAVAYVRRHATRASGSPILLYLPPTGAAFAALSRVPRSDYVGLQIQSRDGESLRHLRDATSTLVTAIPRVHIMMLLAESIPRLSSAAVLFGQRVLRILGAGQRPTVGNTARALGLSPRTLQRRFTADGLPPPKAFLDWLTLAHISAVAASHNIATSSVAAHAGLTSNEMYRLRKRLSGALAGRCRPLHSALEGLGAYGPHIPLRQ
jgi:AraC-like DNA-binding protein